MTSLRSLRNIVSLRDLVRRSFITRLLWCARIERYSEKWLCNAHNRRPSQWNFSRPHLDYVFDETGCLEMLSARRRYLVQNFHSILPSASIIGRASFKSSRMTLWNCTSALSAHQEWGFLDSWTRLEWQTHRSLVTAFDPLRKHFKIMFFQCRQWWNSWSDMRVVLAYGMYNGPPFPPAKWKWRSKSTNLIANSFRA